MSQPLEKKTLNKEETSQYTTLRNKSIVNPPVSDNGHIEVFKKMVVQDLQSIELKKVRDAKDIEIGIKRLENRKKSCY